MDTARFDALTRSLSRRPTRRITLRLLAGGLLGGLLPRQEAVHTRAAQAEMVELFPEADVLLSCAAVGLVDCAGTCCATDETCINGVCLGVVTQSGTGMDVLLLTCENQGLTDCFGVCVDVLTDPANCGGCGGVCGGSDSCFGGACLTPEPPAGLALTCAEAGLVDCDGTCVDLGSDNSHCGACYNSCPLGGFCQAGVCTGLVCFDGLTDCGVGSCVDLLSDGFNCGSCGVVCPEGPEYCVSGHCTTSDPVETGGGGGGSAALDCGDGREQTDEFGRKTGFCDPIMHPPERPSG